MPNRTILVFRSVVSMMQDLSLSCEKNGLTVVAPRDAASAVTLLNYAQPRLLCIDASEMLTADVPILLRPFIGEACRHGLPMVVLS